MRWTQCRTMIYGIALAAVLSGAAGCTAPSDTFCILYRSVPLTEADVAALSLPALRAVEANETRADKFCR